MCVRAHTRQDAQRHGDGGGVKMHSAAGQARGRGWAREEKTRVEGGLGGGEDGAAGLKSPLKGCILSGGGRRRGCGRVSNPCGN